jgi:hypothetical protein
VATSTMPADEIQRQMRRVRAELGDDVQGLVDSAQVATDWHSYVRAYPWLAVGAAAAVGYLIIPSRPRIAAPDAGTLREIVQSVAGAGKAASQPSLVSMVARMAAGALLQGAVGILKQQLMRYAASAPPPARTEDQFHD